MDRRDRGNAWLVFLAFTCLYVTLSLGYVENVDAEMDYQTVRGIVIHRDMAVHGDNPAGRKILEEEFAGSFGRRGKFYSWHGPGRAILAVPFYLAGRLASTIDPEVERVYRASPEDWTTTEARPFDYYPRLFFSLSSALLAAGSLALVYACCRVLRCSPGVATLAVLTLGLATYFGPAARSSLNSMQVAFLLLLATYVLFRYAHPEFPGGGPRRWGLFAMGLAAGFAVWTRPTEVFSAVWLGLYGCTALWKRRKDRAVLGDALSACSGAAVVAFALMFMNYHRFGSVTEFGHGEAIRHANYIIKDPVLLGINSLGLLISPGRGVIWFAPILLLLPVVVRRWPRPFGRERVFLLLAAAPCFIWPIFSSGWHGGPFYGPRYLLPALPWLLILLAEPVGGWWRAGGWRRAIVTVLFLCGVLVQVPGFLVSYITSNEILFAAGRLEAPMPESFLQHMQGLGVEDRETAEQAWNNEQRAQYVVWHPRYFLPYVHAAILWHRLETREGEEELLPLKPWCSLDATIQPHGGFVRPRGLESRHFFGLWAVAYERRFQRDMTAFIFAAFATAAALLGALLLRVRGESKEAGF